MRRVIDSTYAWFAVLSVLLVAVDAALAVDGGPRLVDPRNGWAAFEIITEGDDPPGDGRVWAMPTEFDGLGAQRVDDATLRIQINHEIDRGGATISEVMLDLRAFEIAIQNALRTGSTGGVAFVLSAGQAYDRWTSDGGATWNPTAGPLDTSFSRFCSGQSYPPDTYGAGRGFVDEVHLAGEELEGGRLFALDVIGADLYMLSGHTGADPSGAGIGGMPNDAWENAALIDSGETDHVVLLLSPDGGTEQMRLYVGRKGKDHEGNPSSAFLARNGLACGSTYYLNGSFPGAVGATFLGGSFDDTAAGALQSTKLEDVDTSPGAPDMVVLGDQNSGVFVFDFDLTFTVGSFDAAASSFTVTMVAEDVDSASAVGDADNVDWTAPTTLAGVEHPDGLLLVNEDHDDGQVWLMEPDGSNPVLIGDTAGTTATETSGILDVSGLLGHPPGSIILTDNQGVPSSLTVLINPAAAVAPCAGDLDGSGGVGAADLLILIGAWGGCPGACPPSCPGDLDGSCTVDVVDLLDLLSVWGACP